MNFRVTVRDNRSGGGGISTDEMIVNVVNTGSVFAVTSPNTAVTWSGGSTQNVTWSVAGTTANGINAALVNILLSTDGGNTFPIVLAANTPNDGSQPITVPNLATSTARIRVEAVGNIFFDISNANFTITAPIAGIDLYGSALSVSPSNLIAAGGLANVNFTVGNQGNTAASAFDVKYYLSDDANIDPASDMLLTLDPSGAYYDASEPSAYHVSGGLAAFGIASAAIHVVVPTVDPFHTDNQYYIGMVVDADGDVAEADETNNRNSGDGLDRQNVVYSSSFANAASITIPTSGNASPYPSTVNVAVLAGTISDVNVSLFGFTHTFPDDVDVLLVGPAGQKLLLFSDVGGSNSVTSVNLVLDDSAAGSLSNSGQLSSGTYKPTNFGSGSDTFGSPAPASPYSAALSALNGTNPNGTWSLYVVDDNSSDSGAFSGGWALTFVLANAAPTNPANQSLAPIDEDISDGSNIGRLVSAIIAGSGSTDPDGNPLGIAVTSVENSHGQWQYSTNGGSSWQNLAGVSLTSARLLGPAHYVRFMPNPDFNSQVATSPTLAFKAWDQTAGAAGGTGDTTVGSAYSAATAVATLPVTAVNDAPDFALSTATVAANEDDGPVSVSGFATSIARGPVSAIDEAGQTLTFVLAVSGTAGNLTFDVAPSIDSATGTLSFTATANTNGTATVEVVLQDNGSGTSPNVNVSSSQQFTIEVSAVNDAPSFAIATPIVAVNEDAGAVTVSGFATSIVPGPATATDEAVQGLVFSTTVIGTTGTLSFDVAPSINPSTGDLTFTTTMNTNGMATVEVVLQDDGASTSPNVNASPTQQFSIEIAPVNDEQVLSVNAGLVVEQGASATITSQVLETTDIDNSPTELVYTITAGPLHGAVLVNGAPASQFSQQQLNAGVVSYQNDSAANSTDSFEFAVDDGAGSTSTATFNITIRPNPGDYDQNLVVEAADFVLWRKTLDSTAVPAYSGADGDGDGTIDQEDYGVWRAHFGQTLPPPATGSRVAALEVSRSAAETGSNLILQQRTLSTSASVENDFNAAYAAVLSILDAHSSLRHTASQLRERNKISKFTESVDDDLSLLLAINRVERSATRDFIESDDGESDEYRTHDGDSRRLTDCTLVLSLAEWR
jgi:subtilisin-like proprotein convertase family protein